MSLSTFFSSVARYLEDPTAFDAFRERHPGWQPNKTRVDLHLRKVEGLLRDQLGKTFEKTKVVLGDKWLAVADEFVQARPNTTFDLVESCESFPAFLAERLPKLRQGSWISSLTHLEWERVLAVRCPTPFPKSPPQPVPNPSLRAVEHPWQLWPHFGQPRFPDTGPARGKERVWVYRDPLSANPKGALEDAWLKKVLELAQSGRASPKDKDVIKAASLGLLLLPKPKIGQ